MKSMIELSNPAIDVVVVARNVEAMLAFYGETLGLRAEPVVHLPNGDASVHKFRVGQSRVRVVVLPTPPAAGHPDKHDVYAAHGYRLFTVHVRDVDDVAARCTAAGLAVTGPFPLRPGVRVAVLHDPDGNAIEAFEAAPAPAVVDLAAELPDRFGEMLGRKVAGVISTIRPDGSLSTHPVSPVFDAGTYRVSVRADRQKVRNLRRDPRVGLCVIDTGPAGRYIELRGWATITADGDRAFARRMAQLHMGQDDFPDVPPDAARVVVSIHATEVSYSGW